MLGFLVGAILFSSVPISAAIEEFICYRADYKVLINGEEYISEDLPVLNYKGNTYAPFRSILEKAGLEVAWNADLGQAEVSSPTSAQIDNGEVNKMSIEYDVITGLPVGAEYVEREYDSRKYKAISYNGKTYISESDLKRVYNIAYSTKGTFINKDTNETVTINFRTDTLAVKAVIYTDLSLFDTIIGE
jgi:hypothetical protein